MSSGRGRSGERFFPGVWEEVTGLPPREIVEFWIDLASGAVSAVKAL